MTTLASLKASASASPDQISLYCVVDSARVGLKYLSMDISARERARPGAAPSPIQIKKARVIARNLVRALEAFEEQR